MSFKTINSTTLSFAFFVAGFFLPFGISTLALGIFLVVVLIEHRGQISLVSLRNDPFYGFQIAIWIFSLLSMLWTSNQNEGWTEVTSKLPFLVVPIVLAGKSNYFQKYKMVFFDIIWLGGLLISLICIGRVLVTSSLPDLFANLVYDNLAKASGLQPIYLSLFLIVASLAWYLRYIHQQSLSLKKAWILLFFYLMIIMLSSRTELMVYLVSFAVILAYEYMLKRKIVPILLLILMLGALAFLLIKLNPINNSRFTEMVQAKKDYTQSQWGGSSLRIEKWKNALECYAQFPLLGTGAGDCNDELIKTYQKNNFDVAIENQFNPHNQFLQTLLTLGIVGIVCLLGFYVLMAYRAQKNQDIALFVFVVICSMSMLTESLLERQTGLFLIVVLSNIFYLQSKPEKIIPH